MSSTNRRLRLLKLEQSPIAIPDLPMLTDSELQNIIDGNDDPGTMTQQQIDAVVRGRSVDELTDRELNFIVR